MKPLNKTILYDFLIMSQCDYDTYDKDYDGVITCVCIDDEPTDFYDKFYHEMCKKVEIVEVTNGSNLICNWSELIERNLDKFKAFAKENWKYAYEDDDDELIYQWIKEIHMYFAGYVSDNFYEKLCEFADTLG